jgi:hypothetical protein
MNRSPAAPETDSIAMVEDPGSRWAAAAMVNSADWTSAAGVKGGSPGSIASDKRWAKALARGFVADFELIAGKLLGGRGRHSCVLFYCYHV